MILYHSIVISLFSNLHDLEIASECHQAKVVAAQIEYANSWELTAGAKRAIPHIIQIRHVLSRLSFSIVLQVPLPQIAFQSTIICWRYIRFKEMSEISQISLDGKDRRCFLRLS